MGVDWYACNTCSDTFPDCGDYVGCECGEHWCSSGCAEVEGYRHEEEGYTPEGSKWSQETSCNHCRKEEYSDLILLNYCLELIGKSREEIISQYNQSK